VPLDQPLAAAGHRCVRGHDDLKSGAARLGHPPPDVRGEVSSITLDLLLRLGAPGAARPADVRPLTSSTTMRPSGPVPPTGQVDPFARGDPASQGEA
jgi:hypothetical protein